MRVARACPPRVHQGIAEPYIFRLDFDRRLKRVPGLIDPADLFEDASQIYLRVARAWVDGEGMAKMCKRFVVAVSLLQRESERIACRGIVGLGRDRVPESGYRLIMPFQCLQRRATPALRFDIIGIDRKRRFVAGDCPFIPSDCVQCCAEPAIRLGVIGINGKRALIARNRLVVPGQGMEGDGKPVMRFGAIRVDGERALIGKDRFIGPAEQLEGRAEIGMGLGGIGIATQRRPSQFERLCAAPLLKAQHAQVKQRHEMLAVGRKDRPIDRLGLAQSTLPVQRQRLCESLVEKPLTRVRRRHGNGSLRRLKSD